MRRSTLALKSAEETRAALGDAQYRLLTLRCDEQQERLHFKHAFP